MRAIAFAVGISLLAQPLAHAGHVYGALREGSGPVKEGTQIEVVCQNTTYPARTEKDGSYRVLVSEKGKCTFRVLNYKGQSPSTEIHSYDDPVGYDFELVLENGEYRLVRTTKR